MKSNDIVITGSGVISSIGNSLDLFSKNLFSSRKEYKNHKLILENKECIDFI